MKDIYDAVNERIKNPYLGYAALAFVGLNWKGFFLLLMTDGTPGQRLEEFDSVTSFCSLVFYPFLIGLLVAASSQWVKWLFGLFSYFPMEKIYLMPLNLEHAKILRNIELEKARVEIAALKEREAIDRAKRDEDVSKIKDDSERNKLTKKISAIREPHERILRSSIRVSDLAKALVESASKDSGSGKIVQNESGNEIFAGFNILSKGDRRQYLKYKSAINELINLNYVAPVGLSDSDFELTVEGWNFADGL